MSRLVKASVFAALSAACLCLTALPVVASCVYNHTQHTVHAELDCGIFCDSTWYISKGDNKCRPGKGGTVYINIGQLKNPDFWCADECKVKVDDHGWVSVTQDGDRFTTTSKHADGSVREKCTVKKYSE